MWLVRNNLKATLSLRGLDVSIPPGEQFDLDVLGRGEAEGSNQVLVALEEGYLENVFKASSQDADPGPASGSGSGRLEVAGLSADQFEARMDEFRAAFIQELKSQLSGLPQETGSGAASKELSADVKELVGEVKEMRKRFDTERGRVQQDRNLSQIEIKARLAFLEEKERELLKNFETVGRRVEQDDGDVMDMADLLAGL